MKIIATNKNGEPVQYGDFVESFRGEWYRVADFAAPRGASTGRVFVVGVEDDPATAPSHGYYPSVFGIELMAVEDTRA